MRNTVRHRQPNSLTTVSTGQPLLQHEHPFNERDRAINHGGHLSSLLEGIGNSGDDDQWAHIPAKSLDN